MTVPQDPPAVAFVRAMPPIARAMEAQTMLEEYDKLAAKAAGFTQADVDMCNALAKNWTIDFGEMQDLMASLRDRIAALLPPEAA